MEKQLSKLQAIFKGAKPTVSVFEAHLKTLSDKKRERQLYELCQLAFGYYEKCPLNYRKFIGKYLKHNRSSYIDYLTLHTPLGSLRYSLLHPDLSLQMFHLLETAGRTNKVHYRHLASCLLLVFNIPYKISTLAKYLSLKRHSPEEILQLAGKTEIWEDDVVDVPSKSRNLK